MAQIQYRANLTVGYMPMLASMLGQTVIVPRQDQNITPRETILQGESQSAIDRGFPQVFYMHNVFPTNYGFKSIGFNQRIAGIPDITTFQDIFVLRDIDENKFFYSPVSGFHYVYDATVGHWQTASNRAISSSSLVTVAYLNGNTYIFFEHIGMFQYDTITKVLVPVALAGVTATLLNGICASNGYLLAWDDFTVYRSQATNVLDFTTDPFLGSGSSIPNDIKGKIICCLPITDGFIIYCAKNAVGASFQNNIQYPFQYKEIKGSGGIQSPSQVTWTANLGVHYVWSINGLLQLNKTSAIQVFPEVTDFLTARQYETFDEVTNEIVSQNLGQPLNVRLSLIADRFLVISFGITAFTDAFVQDLDYKRFGRVKLDHVAAFEWYQPNFYGAVRWVDFGIASWQSLGNTSWSNLVDGFASAEAPNETFAFLKKDGTIVIVALDNISTEETGVLILGKYQFQRTNFLVLDEVSIQNAIPDSPFFNLMDLYTIDGKNFYPAEDLFEDPENVADGTLVNFYSSIEARNHSLVLKGTFNICDVQLTFHLGGHQ